jgi:tetratricopeptide (TPR) repeat protein
MRCFHTVVVVILATGLACAPRRPGPSSAAAAPVPQPPPVDVTALIRQGCFESLERALRAAQGEQAFEVAVLLTLRAKELGMPYADYRDRAGALLPDDPLFATYLDVVDALPADALSGERYRPESGGTALATRAGRDVAGPLRLPSQAERVATWRAALSTGPGSELLRRYLEITIGCILAPPNERSVDDPAETDPPLLRYRVGICGGQGERLRGFRERQTEFVDADFPLARLAMSARPADLDEGLRRLQAAHDAFPASLAIATALGGVHEEREEWVEALAAYDEVLTRMPDHRDALLGRTTALSRLRRHEEAVAAAARMIALGSWFLGEAHYWKAWNEFSMQQYSLARADADRARSLMVNAAVFVLSGLSEWNELRLPTAESEFEEALKMDFGRCDAARYLGRVRMQRNKVPEAKAAFQQAIQCFDLSITVRQKLIADIATGPGSDATKARLRAGHERAIAAATADRDECRQNLDALEKRGTQSSLTRP